MKRFLLITGSVLMTISALSAQISHGGIPVSFSQPARMDIDNILMPDVNADLLLAEDENSHKGRLRFGFEMTLDRNTMNSGTWTTLENGGVLWQLGISSPGAYSINLTYDDFYIPEGGEFFVYSIDRSVVYGAYTSDNNNEFRKFATQPVAGDMIMLEYFHPDGNDSEVSINIDGVIHGYRAIPGLSGLPETRTAGACNNNVACPEGEPWANEIRSVARTLTQGWLCSGALVNNTSEDESQYFLTAYHCVEGLSTAYSIFLWNYQASTCTGNYGPTSQTVQGAVVRASSQDIYNSPDFALLEINSPLPESYNVFYSGWTRATSFPQMPVGIHHPDGDIKKISFDDDSAFGYNYNKWNVIWDDGVTEPGSSGSPLYDDNHFLVGDLSTGSSACNNQSGSDQYGKFFRAWNYGGSASLRLRDWLDPEGLDPENLSGFDPFAEPEPDPYTLGDVNSDELINVQDIIMVVGIILGTVEPDLTMNLAADANEDGIVNVLDVITIVGMILDGNLMKGGPLQQIYLENNGSALILKSEGDAAGIQLNVSGEFNINPETILPGIELYHNLNTVLLFSTDGTIIRDGELFSYNGNLNIESAIAGDWYGEGINAEITNVLASGYLLHKAYPNPFNPETNISFILPASGQVELSIYNINGEEIARLIDSQLSAGIHDVIWAAHDYPSGVYFIHLNAGGQFMSQKLVLMK